MVNFQRNVVCLLGLPFDIVDLTSVSQRLRDDAAGKTRCFLSTPNTNWVVNCLTDSAFRDSVVHSDLSIVDGKPLAWIARLLGIPLAGPVPGASVFDALRARQGRQLSVFFFGGEDGVAEAAFARLRIENQGLTSAGFKSPGFGSVEEMSGEDVIERINASNADFVVVSLGARKGQAWIERNRERLSAPLICHLGAVVNFVAGKIQRAPVWFRDHGCEWLWRIKEEPSLFKRYFHDGLVLGNLFLLRVLPYAWYLRRHRPKPGSLTQAWLRAASSPTEHQVRLGGPWERANISPLRECFEEASRKGGDVVLDLSQVTYIDSAFIGLAVLLRDDVMQRGFSFRIVGAQKHIRRVIKYCCADYLFHSAAFRADTAADCESNSVKSGDVVMGAGPSE